jgi:hypothetical protein
MVSLILLSIAILFVIVFSLTLLIDEGVLSRKMKQEVSTMMSFNTNWNLKGILSKISPVMIGIGFLGLIMSEFWSSSLVRIGLVGFVFGIISILTILQWYFSKKHQKSDFVLDILLIFQFFSTGAFLFALNEFVIDQRWNAVYAVTKNISDNQFTHSVYFLGSTELLAIWIIISLIFAYITRSTLLFILGFVFNILFFTNYYFNEVNIFSDIFQYQYRNVPIPYHINYFTCFIFPFILAILYPVLYAFHFKKNHQNGDFQQRIFYNLTALMSFFSAGGLMVYSLWQPANRDYINQTISMISPNSLYYFSVPIIDFIEGILAFGIFVIDQVFKKKSWYNVSFTASAFIATFGILGFLLAPKLAFLGFFLFPLPFISWLLADYLRQKSKIAMVLFYIFNPLLLWFLAVDNTRFDRNLLFIMLGIMLYAAWLHKYNRMYIFYCILMAVFGITIGFFGLTFNGYTFLIIGGFALLVGSLFFREKVQNTITE